MSCLFSDDGQMVVCGNFEELLSEKPKDFDFENSYRWIEPYPFDKRDVIGGTVCNCKYVRVNYQPWYGYDYYHQDSCFLMQKYRATPNACYFWAMENLPAITFSENSVPANAPKRMFIQGRSTSSKVKVRTSPVKDIRQGALL